MGGGILPIATHNNKLYFLFSREYIYGKSNPGLYSDFGGTKEKNESYKQAAIREGWEESSGILGNKQNIKYLIENKTTDTITINGHRSYIVLIDYDEELPKKFRENFIKVKEKFPDRINKKGFYEKDKLLWIESTKLEENMNKFRPWYRIIVREIINKL